MNPAKPVKRLFALIVIFFTVTIACPKESFSQKNDFAVIAYYAGGPEQVDSLPIEKLTHIIFSFSHLKGNQLHVNTARDSATIKKLGKSYEISFAAGGFKEFIDKSIEWKKVMKKVNRVNLMTYDLVNGYSTITGHHTPLYSTPYQTASTDQAVTALIKAGIPKNKIVIGAAFYARVWENVPDSAFGLYQPGKYKKNVNFRNFDTQLSVDSGFIYHWDEVAQAPYMYNPTQRLFATFDDKKSIRLKTQYVLDQGLNGIMFWQLAYDSFENGLLEAIDEQLRNEN